MPDILNINWDQMAKDSSDLAKQLKNLNTSWHTIVAIARGGMVPATIVSHKLGIRWVDTVSINSYDDQTFQQQELEVLKELKSNSDRILVIDDLVDTGETFSLVKDMLPNAHFACVYAKPKGLSKTDTYLREIPQETWIVFPWEDSVKAA